MEKHNGNKYAPLKSFAQKKILRIMCSAEFNINTLTYQQKKLGIQSITEHLKYKLLTYHVFLSQTPLGFVIHR